MANEEWANVTIVGSAYETELEVLTSRYRHRPIRLPLPSRAQRLEGAEIGFGEWRKGLPPDWPKK